MKLFNKASSTGGSVAAASPPASKNLFTCPECNLRYTEESWAKKCEQWCREHKSCNLDIIKHAVP